MTRMTPSDLRATSPEFSEDYERQVHFRNLYKARNSVLPVAPTKPRVERKGRKGAVSRIQIIQMADLPRYHYEVWANYSDGTSELLCPEYIHGLREAVRMAVEKWGRHEIILDRYSAKRIRPTILIFSPGLVN